MNKHKVVEINHLEHNEYDSIKDSITNIKSVRYTSPTHLTGRMGKYKVLATKNMTIVKYNKIDDIINNVTISENRRLIMNPERRKENSDNISYQSI